MESEVLLALFSKHIDERLLSLHGIQGPRGFRGPPGNDGLNGKDFVFSENEEQIRSWAKEFALKFSDLTEEEIASLRGQDGENGKGFVWDENREEIFGLIVEAVKGVREDLKLRFSDLEADDIERLRGPRGRDGLDGRNFNFDDHIEFFESLKLKFSDLSEEEVFSLKLQFSDLSEEEKATLKLHFSDLTEEDRTLLRGPRGVRGQKGRTGENGKDGLSVRGLPGPVGPRGLAGVQGRDGRDGQDGTDGQDAPTITSVDAHSGKDGLVFTFEFSDGTVLETSGVDLPTGNTYVIGGGRVSSVATEYETRVDEPTSAITYVGKAYIGANTADAIWQIKKILTSGTETSIEWANSSDSFANIWDDRASLTYG